MAVSDIQVLTTTESIRKRPGLYFDLTNPRLATHLLVECLCWAPRHAKGRIELMDEGMARVTWEPKPDHLKKVMGRPFPAGMLTGVPAPGPPRAFDTELACGGGWAIVVAVSTQFDAFFRDAEAEWGQRFENGESVTEFEILGDGGEPEVLFDLELDATFLPNLETKVSWKVFKRDGYACRYCGNDDVPLTIDHLVLWEEGGPSTVENLVSACKKCNRTRGNTPYADWLKHRYYLKVSKGLTADVRQQNDDLVATLDAIPRMVHKRSR